MEQKGYMIEDTEAGNSIESVETIEKAKVIIKQYEETDRAENNFTPNFYSIRDLSTGEIIKK